ncbi:MAG: acyl carrier protein [Atopobiaceae bacterium]|jgi:acyl carrier protein|nr:acyl carrier protein [Atopobiaceae bacterium]
MDITLDDVVEMLEDIQEDVDYRACTTLIDDHVLDSFDILAIVSAADDEFDVTIPAKDIIPANFNSAQALCALIQRLADED